MRRAKKLLTAALSCVAVVLPTVAITVTSAVQASAEAAVDEPDGGRFVPTQGRIFDTRTAANGAAPLTANVWRSVQVGGLAGVPTTGVSAVQVTFTAVGASGTGTLHALADGATSGGLSMLNYSAGAMQSNMGTVALSSAGKIMVRANTASTHLVIDVQGYYTSGPVAAGGYKPVTPARFVDSRIGLGTSQSKFSSTTARTLEVGGQNGIPLSAKAVIVNFTLVVPSGNGNFQVWPSTGTKPATAASYFNNAQTTNAIEMIVPLDPSSGTGAFNFQLNSLNASGGASNTAVTADLVADVVGYFTAGGSGGGYRTTAGRVLDTRTAGTGGTAVPIPSNGTRTLAIQGAAGVPIGNAAAAVLHVTVVPTGTNTYGFINMWANGTPEPATSGVNYGTATVSNTLTTELGVDGYVTIANHGPWAAHVVIDVEGYYTPLVVNPEDEDIVSDLETVPASVVQNMERSSTSQGQTALQDAANSGLDVTSEPMSVYISSTQTLVIPQSEYVEAHTGKNQLGETVVNFSPTMSTIEDSSTPGYAAPPRDKWKALKSKCSNTKIGNIWQRKACYTVMKANNYNGRDYYEATRQVQGELQSGSYKKYKRLWDEVILDPNGNQVDDWALPKPSDPIGVGNTTSQSYGFSTGVDVYLGIPPLVVSGTTSVSWTATVESTTAVVWPLPSPGPGDGGSQWCVRDGQGGVESRRTIVNRTSFWTKASTGSVDTSGAPDWQVNTGMSTEQDRCPDS